MFLSVSVIIPTYNRVNLIKFTLDSLDEAYHTDIQLEVIVIDDGSTDGTLDFIAKQYPGIVLLKNKGKGAALARNIGLMAAKGKYIMYLDSDDLVGANYFAQKLLLLEQHPELDACYGEYDVFCGGDALDPDK